MGLEEKILEKLRLRGFTQTSAQCNHKCSMYAAIEKVRIDMAQKTLLNRLQTRRTCPAVASRRWTRCLRPFRPNSTSRTSSSGSASRRAQRWCRCRSAADNEPNFWTNFRTWIGETRGSVSKTILKIVKQNELKLGISPDLAKLTKTCEHKIESGLN